MNINKNKPNFFVVGTAKAGTTSLYNYIQGHPDVFLSPIKEPNYFNTELKYINCRKDIQKNIYIDFKKYLSKNELTFRHNACIDNMDDYLSLYRDVKNQKVIADFSTSYLSSRFAPSEIYNFNSNAKILIMIREPVSRTVSHYNMDVNNQYNSGNTLNDLIEDYNSEKKGYFISNNYIDLSLYYDDIKKYLTFFPSKQLLVVRFEDFISNKNNVLSEICKFLDIDFNMIKIKKDKVHNKTWLPKHRSILFFKKALPKFVINQLKFFRPLFYKPSNSQTISVDVIKYINSITLDDYKKTIDLVNKYGLLKK